MMKFILKWLINGVIVSSILVYATDVTFINAFVAATGLTIIAYLLGDQLVLRSTNNVVATIADFGLTALYFGVLSGVFKWDLSLGETLFIALMVGAAEWILHVYIFNEHAKTKF